MQMPHACGAPPMLWLSATRGVLHLALLGLALQLLVVLVDHAHAGGAGRMAEGLQPAVGVHRQLAVERERAARDVLLRRALLAEAEVLVGEQLGEREAVVHLGDVDLLPRVRDAGLRVDLLGRDLGRASSAGSRSSGPPAGSATSAMPMRPHQDVVVAEALRELAPRDDRGGGAVGLRGAVVEAERPRDDARASARPRP